MMGKSGCLLLGVFLVSFMERGLAQAPEPKACGFQDVFEFVMALEEMPVEEFVRVASETSGSSLQDFHAALSKLDSRHFDAWNQKLRLIPGPGFARNSNFWELHAQVPEMTIGFKPEEKPGAFISIVDFYESALEDELAVFQARASATSEADFDRWLEVLQKRDLDLYLDVLAKLEVMRTVGFLPDQEYRMIVPDSRAPAPIGFGAREPASVGILPFRSSAEIVVALHSLSPEDFRARLLRTSLPQRKRLLEALKKRDPESYTKLEERLKSRTRIGFSTSATPEIIIPPKKDEPIAPVGFRIPEPTCAELLMSP